MRLFMAVAAALMGVFLFATPVVAVPVMVHPVPHVAPAHGSGAHGSGGGEGAHGSGAHHTVARDGTTVTDITRGDSTYRVTEHADGTGTIAHEGSTIPFRTRSLMRECDADHDGEYSSRECPEGTRRNDWVFIIIVLVVVAFIFVSMLVA